MKTKTFVTGLVIGLMVGITTSGFAAGGIIDIAAQMDSGLKILLNGNKFVAKESSGTEILPILYKGRTYLPVRAVAEAVGLAVDYDSKENTVILGERTDKITDFSNVPIELDSFYKSEDIEELTMNGVVPKSKFGFVSEKWFHHTASFSLGGKYSKLGFSVGTNFSLSNRPLVVTVSEKGTVIKNITLSGQNQDIEVDVSGRKDVQIYIGVKTTITGDYDVRESNNFKDSKYVITNFYLK